MQFIVTMITLCSACSVVFDGCFIGVQL